ncbi:MAG: leucine-rich repeat domain-containing protein [Lachnospira sp.]|nr:leucine-rich repeat domain-containing protein [Lachnospira sp.]
MKKIVSLIMVLIMCCGLFACGDSENKTAGADSGNNDANNNQSDGSGDFAIEGSAKSENDYFKWSETTDTIIVGYTEKGLQQTELVIPAECTTVMQLDENPTVKKITFENDDTVILSGTFSKCSSLESVALPANLTKIETYVFSGCSSLKSIDIPKSVTEIDNSAFKDCVSLTTVNFNSKLETISLNVFEGCSALDNVVIPNSVTLIEGSAFLKCAKLQNLTFGTGIKTIDKFAFNECDSLKEVKLCEGVEVIGKSAFKGCDSIESIYLPASLKSIRADSLEQKHKYSVYVVKGSYADTEIDNIKTSNKTGSEYIEKKYQ